MDLHSGMPYWIIKNPLYDHFNPLTADYAVDVAIIGSGITGALTAHTLCAAGVQCCVIDKRTISTGSSAASTALLQYEIDELLCDMIDMTGEKTAVAAYTGCLQSIADLGEIFAGIGHDPEFKKVPSVFYANTRRDAEKLRKEYAVRKKFSLPVEFLGPEELRARFSLNAPAALVNEEAAQMDTYSGATALLRHNMKKYGLDVFSHTEITEWKKTSGGYRLTTGAGHTITCRFVVIAAGFEAGQFLPERVMNLTSTYALISEPLPPESLWPERSLIWETGDPYLYLRTTEQNRIIVGGEDEEFSNPVRRDKLLRSKVATLERKFRRLFPEIPFVTDMAWCGTFSSTKDGLPYIGPWPGDKRMLFALGYGGNGITFSMIAAQVLANTIQGIPDERITLFGFKRHT
ncbi:conserved hypothetical protein [uncultured delta proteobacterium]|uniref:FAD dependent oxidoreductase domain-containing protein n=1 Tax=uncultured delta proteobacterium TaxID=34034 RepID=A0A212JF61_9DELT|nr:conserved hypothetical protein [uncultured delta proteobacterium]